MDLAATAGGGNAGAAAMDAASEPAGAFFPSPLLDGEPGRHGSLFGSSLLKQPREQEEQQDPCRLPKMAKTESFLPPKSSSSPAPSLLRSSSHSLFPEGQQMLSFSQSPAPPSPPRQEALLLCGDGSLPYYHHHHLPPISASHASYVRAPGMSSASMNLHGGATMAGAKGYFTPSQWVELEHQAMIYKCLDANVPIPPSLLISIRKSLYPSAYAAYSTGSMRPGAYGWGSFQLGFTGNTDPEPGRCRRTDGKKWRCTRDAVADQKYCERHLNRGRHRSRKPVEGQTGQAKAMSAIARSPASLAAVSGSGSSNCSSISQKHLKSFQPASTEPSPSQLNRISLDKGNVPDPHSLPFAITQNSKVGDAHFLVSKQHNPFEETLPGTDFGLNCTSSLLATSRTSSYPLRSFMEEWPNSHSDGLNPSWPGTDEDPSDRTQLSMSIPIHSDLPSHSPTQDKMGYSSLKLEEEFDGVIHMGLGMGNNSSQKHTNLVPISWESSSMGGPLGEVLNNTCNSLKDSTVKNTTSSLNLATTGWDTSPPESSPTGVLQKTAFCSLSGSTGSSPRLENFNSHESSGSLHDHLLGSTLFNPATIPLL